MSKTLRTIKKAVKQLAGFRKKEFPFYTDWKLNIDVSENRFFVYFTRTIQVKYLTDSHCMGYDKDFGNSATLRVAIDNGVYQIALFNKCEYPNNITNVSTASEFYKILSKNNGRIVND